ncbi:hypothetical protein VC83_00263 [Pseudogymnoascus destructans]|uniref:Uncharacterized protein n=1 Tax=Pseudogymnoascus destructans TaxID=655981 RepID=A0A177ANT6_9PEZI|nr:uncharacterized protein VC83_00263 [Pseudogymnoascus destructans]OAF62953.1 hypothetical protein VC83_00263 [Pseudogymnoascus destructans]
MFPMVSYHNESKSQHGWRRDNHGQAPSNSENPLYTVFEVSSASSPFSDTDTCSPLCRLNGIFPTLAAKEPALLINHHCFRRCCRMLAWLRQCGPQSTPNYDRPTEQAPPARQDAPDRKVKRQRKQHLRIQHTRRLATAIELQPGRQQELQGEANHTQQHH